MIAYQSRGLPKLPNLVISAYHLQYTPFRYIAVHTPLKRHKLLTCGKAKLVQSAIVFSAIFYNFIRFWEYERASDSMLIRPLLRENHAYFLYYYVLLYMITHFLAPFAVILVLNMFVVCSLRAVNKDKLRRISRSEKQQRKTTQMIVVRTENASSNKSLRA